MLPLLSRSRAALAGICAYIAGLHATRLVVLGYLSYVVMGWVALCIPWVQRSPVDALDNLFIATSAMSTTGLVTVSVSDNYNFAGQLIVLVLIQLGGIGYMTFGSFVILSRKSELPQKRSEIGQAVFSLPASFRIDEFIRHVIVFTVVIEAVGACCLYLILRRAGAEGALWSAIFHSVSAFCTAGFGLYNDSFMAYRDNFWLNAVIAALSYVGAFGFIVCSDFWRMITGRVRRMTLTSKIILWVSLWLSAVSTLLIFLGETSIRTLPVEERLVAAFFQAMTAMTTVGFNTIDIASLSRATLLVLIFLMIVGASPSGTGGGLKSTTFSALLGIMRSALHGEREVRFWGRLIPNERVWSAVASLGFYMLMLLVGTYLLELTQNFAFEQNLFEAASALGTVGLSTGITAGLTGFGKIIIVLLMFCGRLGPLTFSVALFFRPADTGDPGDNDLAV